MRDHLLLCVVVIVGASSAAAPLPIWEDLGPGGGQGPQIMATTPLDPERVIAAWASMPDRRTFHTPPVPRPTARCARLWCTAQTAV